MKRTFLTCAAFILTLTLAGCSDNGSKQVTGAWKSVENSSLSGKPITLVITENRLSLNEQSADVVFEKKDAFILIKRPGDTSPILTALPKDQDHVTFTNHVYGEKEFIRTTEDDVKAILAAPSPTLKSKPDPF